MWNALCTFLMSIVLTAVCAPSTWADDFVISSGNHYSSPRKVGLHRGSTLRFKALFDGSAEYDLGDEDQLDTNKLYGTSDCGDKHSENSARFGWRWNDGKLEIMAYTHVSGAFDFKLIGEAKIGRPYDYEIGLSEDKQSYVFNFNGSTVTMKRGCSDSGMTGYKLYPYFGGDKTAPHNIKIKIEEDADYANFSLDKIYPNPTGEQHVFLNLEVGENLSIGFKIYDLQGRLVQVVDPIDYTGGSRPEGVRIELNQLSSGMYLIQPFAMEDGKEKRGFVNAPGQAMKLIVI